MTSSEEEKISDNLIQLLSILDKKRDDVGIFTKEICDELPYSQDYSMRILRKAYKDGFVRCEIVLPPNSNAWTRLYFITDKGKALIEKN